MFLGAGMHVMAAQTGDCSFFTGMQIVKVAGTVTEAILVGLLVGHQRLVMALKTEFVDRKTELVFEVGYMRGMAAKAIILLDRAVDALLAGLVFVTLITDLGALVLDTVQDGIILVVAPGNAVAGCALFISQTAVNKWGLHFAAMTFEAGFSAYGINRSLGFSGRYG